MVQVRIDSLDITQDKINIQAWLQKNCKHYSKQADLVLEAITFVQAQAEKTQEDSHLSIALQITEILCDLHLAVEVIVASVLFPYVQSSQLKLSSIK